MTLDDSTLHNGAEGSTDLKSGVATESMNVLVTIDEGYIKPFKVLAKSIVVNNPKYVVNFMLVYSSIRPNLIDEIRTYCEGIGGRLTAIRIDEAQFGDAPATKRYPLEVYYRLLAPHALPASVERVIYLDCDMLVINSLSPLWEMDLQGMPYAAASHADERSVIGSVNKMRLGIKHEYFNTGVLVMDVNQARTIMTPERLAECVGSLGRRIVLPDQDVFNVVCGERCMPIDEEIWNYDACSYARYLAASRGEHDVDWVMENVSVLHFCWPHKPWKVPYAGRFGSLYKHYMQLADRS